MNDYAEQIDRGSYALVQIIGESWPTRINLVTLDLASDDDCVLGQLFGSFESGCEALEIRIIGARRCGFMMEGSHLIAGCEPDYTALTTAWREHITSLLAE